MFYFLQEVFLKKGALSFRRELEFQFCLELLSLHKTTLTISSVLEYLFP
jgi:hypothetical protein